MKGLVAFGLRWALLSLIYVVLFSVAYGIAFAVLGVNVASGEASDAGLFPLAALACLNTLALAILIVRSRWSAHSLTLVVAMVLYGVATFMTLIESAVFPAVAERMGAGMLPALFLAGLLLAVPFAPLAVLIMGKWRGSAHDDEPPSHRLELPAGDWATRSLLIGGLYVVLYFTFGYYVAWRNPVVQAYYGGRDPGDLLAQLANVARDTPWLYLFQFARGILWMLIAVPILRMSKGGTLETGVIVGLQFALLMNTAHLLPNPLMPEAVRMAHLIETAPSNFILGVLIAAILFWRAKPGTMFSRPAPILR